MQKKQKQPGCQVSSISSDSGEVRGSTWSLTSSMTSVVSSVIPRGHKATDATLDPTSGDLKLRLDNDFPYPVPPGPNKDPWCIFSSLWLMPCFAMHLILQTIPYNNRCGLIKIWSEESKWIEEVRNC
jgi:hypothetical protein